MRLFAYLWMALLMLTPSVVSQEKNKSRLPKVDWNYSAGVWLATAKGKGKDVEVQVSVPMWGPKPDLNGRDPEGPEDFVVSEMKARLKASDVKIYRKNGTLVEPKDLPRLLAKETPVFWWGMDKIDPYYLSVMRDDVLIFIVDFEKVIKASEDASTPKVNKGA